MIFCAGFAATVQAAQYVYSWEKRVGFIRTSDSVQTNTPKAFLQFCQRHPEDCMPSNAPRYVVLDAIRMRDLNTVNMDVNDSLFFNTDLAGRDTWEYPQDGYADCEDYALEKRRRLMDLGWPASTLLLTMAEKKNEELEAWRHHVVLTVRTAQGDYVLDNEIRPAVSWDKAARLYRFTIMQSAYDPRVWVQVDDRRNASVDSASTIR